MLEYNQANGVGIIEENFDELYVPNWLMEVMAWINRLEMANSALSTASRTFHALCWPKLHGKVPHHFVDHLQIEHQIDAQGNTVALAKCKIKIEDGQFVAVPIPNGPMPKYILGFEKIDLNFMDAQIFAFMQQIAPSIGTIILSMSSMQLPIASPIGRLLDMLAEQTTINSGQLYPHIHSKYPLIYSKYLPPKQLLMNMQMLLKCKESWENDEGKQQQSQKLFHLNRNMHNLDDKEKGFIEAIKQDFSNATQPFNFFMFVGFDYPEFSVENERTGETLAFHNRRNKLGQSLSSILIRHPTGQEEQWLAAGKKRFWQSWGKPRTKLTINEQIRIFETFK